MHIYTKQNCDWAAYPRVLHYLSSRQGLCHNCNFESTDTCRPDCDRPMQKDLIAFESCRLPGLSE